MFLILRWFCSFDSKIEWLIILNVVDKLSNSEIIDLLLLIVFKILFWNFISVVFVLWWDLYVDWNFFKKLLLLLRWFINCVVIVFFVILDKKYKFEIGWKLENSLWLVLFFFNNGFNMVVLNLLGVWLFVREKLIIWVIIESR